jgi:hypothetical protein
MAAEAVHARGRLRELLLPLNGAVLKLQGQCSRDDETEPIADGLAKQVLSANLEGFKEGLCQALYDAASDDLRQVCTVVARSGTGKTTFLNNLIAATEMSPFEYSAKVVARKAAVRAMVEARSQIDCAQFNYGVFDTYVHALTHALECCLHEAKEHLLAVTKEAALLNIQTESATLIELSYQHCENNYRDAEFQGQYTQTLQCLEKLQGYVTRTGDDRENVTVHTYCEESDGTQLISQEDTYRTQLERFAMDASKIPNEAFLLPTPDKKAGGRSACTYFNTTVSPALAKSLANCRDCYSMTGLQC